VTEGRSAEWEFVAGLRRLVEREDRAALAALRRGLGKPPGRAPEMYRHVEPLLPRDMSRDRMDAFYLIAALFAWHQRDWTRSDDPKQPRDRDLGASFATIRDSSDASHADSSEKRFTALLSCRREELPVHLRQTVGLLLSKEVRIDWTKLLLDVQRWHSPDHRVQRQWARSYWRVPKGEESQDSPLGGAGEAEL
jgi:CRISPR system Cascade subunit CasB